MRNICWLNNGNTRLPALCAGEAPDEKLKINKLGPHRTRDQSSYMKTNCTCPASTSVLCINYFRFRSVLFLVNSERSGFSSIPTFTLIVLYDNGQSYRVPHLHSPGQLKIHRTQTQAKWGMTTNTAFIIQTVLFEAPYCLLLHPCTTRK